MTSKELSNTVKKVIEAYGGERRWIDAETIDATISASGLAFKLKWQQPFVNQRIQVRVHDPFVTFFDYKKKGQRGVFQGDRVFILDEQGRVIQDRTNARAAFSSLRHKLFWDSLDQLYFAGYAFWNYFTLPALLMNTDIKWKESEENVLKAYFDSAVPTHSADQVFYFSSEGLLKRHDYTADIISKHGHAAHIIKAHGQWESIPFPSERIVHPINPKNNTVRTSTELIRISIHEWELH